MKTVMAIVLILTGSTGLTASAQTGVTIKYAIGFLDAKYEVPTYAPNYLLLDNLGSIPVYQKTISNLNLRQDIDLLRIRESKKWRFEYALSYNVERYKLKETYD